MSDGGNAISKHTFYGKVVQLQRLCTAITDCHHSTPNWTESGWIVVRSENIKRGRIALNNASCTDHATFLQRISRSVPEPGDLIVTREAPMGEVGMIPDGVECCLGQRLVLVKPDPAKVDRHYLLYAMQSQFVQEQIGASDETGSTVSNLRIPTLKELQIPLLEDTKGIGEVLKALDAKIDLNNRINAELEALAKTIYDYWFVQFDFPDAHGRPYKSSGGAMVWNDTLKREIPAGWDVKHLNELLEARSDGVSASGVIEGTPYTPIDSLPMRKMSFGFVRPSTEANTSLIRYRKGDILIGAMRVYFHRVCVAPFDGVTRATTLVLRAKVGDHLPYLYQVCNEDRTIEMASKLSVGTQQPYINWENRLENYSIPYPRDDGLIQKYVAATESFVSAVVNRELENAYLAQLRDWLLPLLMNGQVRVA